MKLCLYPSNTTATHGRAPILCSAANRWGSESLGQLTYPIRRGSSKIMTTTSSSASAKKPPVKDDDRSEKSTELVESHASSSETQRSNDTSSGQDAAATTTDRRPGAARSWTTRSSRFDIDQEKQSDRIGSTHSRQCDNETNGVSDVDQDEFEVRFSGLDDPWNPKSKPKLRRWCIVLVGSACALCVTCASALYTSTYEQMEKDYGVSREVATLGLTTFVAGLGIGPMVLAPLSEFYGRRIVFIVAFGMYFVWNIACAVAPDIGSMLFFRFMVGLAGSAFLSVAGGVVGDLFEKNDLSAPLIIYTASPFVGPEVGPVIGGFINYYTNWRWSFWVLVIWSFVLWILIVVAVPETYAPVLLRRKAIQMRKETGEERWQAPIERMDRSVAQTVLLSCYRPFQLLLFEQMCLNLCLLSAMLLGTLYLFFGAFAVVFKENHGFNEWQTGLTFVAIFVGMVIGVCLDPLWNRNYKRLVRNNGGDSEPEFRLPPTIAGAILVPISLFGFGWTTYKSIHWIVPLIFSAIFGLGNIMCFGGIFTFLVECYPLYGASALAANSFARSSFAAAFPLFGVQMYDNLGYQWASSLLGFLMLALTPFPYLFFKYGKRLRARSRFARS